LNFTLSLLLLSSLVTATLSVVVKNDFHLLDLAMGALGLVVSLTLFSRPGILYGIYSPSSSLQHWNDEPKTIPSVKDPKGKNEEIANDAEQAALFRQKIEHFFLQQKPFLQTNYSLTHLSTDLGTPRYFLSAFINREYRMGFREFLNRHRIEYLLQNIQKPEWSHFTLEAISEECGFNNRSTFIAHFKEVTGQTPSAYLQQRKSISN
jgi:AraC-like DNA-binding protein